MKRVLIIQRDEAYFLFETLQLIERKYLTVKDVELHILVDKNAYEKVSPEASGPHINLHFEYAEIEEILFDESFNLSKDENTWEIHEKVKSPIKNGPYFENGLLVVKDLWAMYLLTLKVKTPFLTIHLQDIYRNILRLPAHRASNLNISILDKIVYAPFATNYFKAEEQEKFIFQLAKTFPHISIIDSSEIDYTEDLSTTLYIGPLSLDACKLVADGARGFFLETNFQGFNLFPYDINSVLISSKGKTLEAEYLLTILEGTLLGKENEDHPYALYSATSEESTSLFLKSQTKSDISYPIYKAHFVLWNFILNLEDVDLTLDKISSNQNELLSVNLNILSKVQSLQEYALNAANTILKQAKSKLIDLKKLEENMQIVRDYDDSSSKVAESHPYLRPILDFYKIRKGQTEAFSLLEQAEESFITYSEEHQVLAALSELFSVTLNKNEDKI